MTFNTILKTITSILLISFLASCSNESDEPKTTKQHTTAVSKTAIEPVKERAVARWNALIEKDWATAYTYESPNYRKSYSKRDFINSFGQAVTWVSIKYLSSTPINETLTDVKLQLLFNYDMSGSLIKIPSDIIERWQLIDNKWWHIKK